MDRLDVDLNQDGLHRIAAPSSFETDGPFEIRLRNHGEAIHVHLNLDDELSRVGRLPAGNHYVEPYSRRTVRIDTRRIDAPVTGRLKIVTGYGTESRYVSVTVGPPGTVTKRVQVDERLAKPQREEPPEPTASEGLARALSGELSPRVAAVGTLGICGLLVAGALVDNTAMFAGSLAVMVSAVAALAITRRRMTR